MDMIMEQATAVRKFIRSKKGGGCHVREKLSDDAINRSYYAAFYAIKSILVKDVMVWD